jgi:putative phosphoribosyl transferase
LSSTEPSRGHVRFADRRDAGRRLAERLLPLADENPVVVALPRGGVPVAREVAVALGAPLDILAVRKLGAPANPEYAIGAIAEDGTKVIDSQAVAAMGIAAEQIDRIVAREIAELRRRIAAYRDNRAPIDLVGRTVIVVDDGVATGLTDMAALRAVRRRKPRWLILAVPVCAPESALRLRQHADQVVCLLAPPRLRGVGEWYRDFAQVSDEQVLATLGKLSDVAA